MNLQQIKDAIRDGKTVHWANAAYRVICDSIGQYLIVCDLNGCCWGLTWRDETTMNGSPEQFFTA